MKSLFEEIFKIRRKARSWLGPILIYILILIAFPLTLDVTKNFSETYYSLVSISSMIVVLMSIENIFLEDFEDGFLEQFFIKNDFIERKLFIKLFAHWIMIGIPISLIGSFFCFVATDSLIFSLKILPCLLIANYIFINIFSFGSALSLNKGSILGTLISMPLVLPILIVLGKTISAILFNINFVSFITLNFGILLIILVLVPYLIKLILKVHIE